MGKQEEEGKEKTELGRMKGGGKKEIKDKFSV